MEDKPGFKVTVNDASETIIVGQALPVPEAAQSEKKKPKEVIADADKA